MSYLPNDITDIIKDMQADINELKLGKLGSVFLDGSITSIDDKGVKTVIGDLTNIGEDRYGVAQFVGDLEPPPIPSKPLVAVSAGVMTVSWDGKNVDDEPMAPDFDHFNVYAVSGGSTSLIGSIKNESETALYAGAEGGSTWQFFLTSVDTNRNESDASEYSDVVTAISAGADPLVYDAIESLRSRMSQAEQDAATANSKATAAQSTADAANTAAANAAGIANGKGKVLIQSSAPDAADRNSQTLWIDTTGGANTPKKWVSGTTWTAVTDKVATDAATAAANAKTAADQASASAQTAMTAANQAQASANGKNNVYYVPSLPGGSNFAVGDTAFIRSTVGQPITATYQWDGSAWKLVTLGHQIIASVDLGKATVGELDGQYIKAGSVTAKSMVLQNTDNLIPDPTFQYGASTWSLSGWTAANGVITKSGSPLTTPTTATDILVTEQKWYAFSASVAVTGSGSVTASIKLLWYNSAGTLIYTDSEDTQLSATSAGTTYSLVAFSTPRQAPLNAVKVIPQIVITGGTKSSIKNLVLSKSMDSTLIVDGSIIGSKVAANSITTDKLLVGDTTNFADFDASAGIVNTATNAIDGNYIRTISGQANYNFFSYRKNGIPFKAGDQVTFKFTAKATAATSVQAKIWCYPEASGGSSNGNVVAIGPTFTIGTTEAEYVTTVNIVPTQVDGSKKSYLVGIQSTTGSAINNNNVLVRNIQVLRMNDSTTIADGAITTDKLTANAVTSDKVAANSITADALSATAITGKTITGGQINGATINGGYIKQAADGTGAQYTTEMKNDSSGGLLYFQTPKTISDGTYGASIRALDDPDYEASLIIRAPGTKNFPYRPALRLAAGYNSESSGLDWTGGTMMISGANPVLSMVGSGNGLIMSPKANLTLASMKNGGRVDVIADYISLTSTYSIPIADYDGGSGSASIKSLGVYSRTYTSSSNVWVTTNGYIGRGTSVRAAKLDIEDLPAGQIDALLNVKPRWWFDKGESERMADYLAAANDPNVSEDPSKVEDVPGSIRRIPGVVAEEVEEAGATAFVTYDADQKLNGVSYDRIGAALLGVVKDQRERIRTLESQVSDLTSRLEALEARLSA